jgi:RNA polymerase sigma-70 factor (ECF subfamily)
MDDSSRVDQIESRLRELIAEKRWDDAFRCTYEAYYPQIAGFCINTLYGHVNDHIADGKDIAQQVFLEFFRTLIEERFRLHAARVRTFLFARARHRCVDELRRLNRGGPAPDVGAYQTEMVAPQPMPEEVLLDEAQLRALWRKIEELRAVDREIVKLHYQVGLSIAEIADVLRLREGNVRTRLSRTLQRLREELRRDE